MKKNVKLAVWWMVGIFAVGCLNCGSLLAADAKYAFLDIAKVFDEYQKTKDNDSVLQGLGKKKEEERASKVQEIKQLKDEQALLNDDSKAKKQEQIEEKVRAHQDFDQAAQRDLGAQRNKVVKEIFQDIDTTVQRYGERKGIDMIFNDRALVYRNAKLDITQEVLTELNQGYKKK